MTRLRLTVTGDVQGVGFRWFAVEQAGELDVAGWVRNRPDGAVEAEAEGEDAAVREFVARLKRGPSAARVDAVAVVVVAPQGQRGFEVRR